MVGFSGCESAPAGADVKITTDFGNIYVKLYDETPNHKEHLADLPAKRVEDVLWAYRDRILDLKKDLRLRYILIFKNQGATAGATLERLRQQDSRIKPIRIGNLLAVNSISSLVKSGRTRKWTAWNSKWG